VNPPRTRASAPRPTTSRFCSSRSLQANGGDVAGAQPRTCALRRARAPAEAAEQHGFRKVENIRRALDGEFYASISRRALRPLARISPVFRRPRTPTCIPPVSGMSCAASVYHVPPRRAFTFDSHSSRVVGGRCVLGRCVCSRAIIVNQPAGRLTITARAVQSARANGIRNSADSAERMGRGG
jgi:hypothetical protein